jgi:hypothetical protein
MIIISLYLTFVELNVYIDDDAAVIWVMKRQII